MSFVEALLPEGLGRSGRLDRLSELVKWYRFEKLLVRLRDPGPGQPGYPPLLMFKALLLQSLYGLSDAELEEALSDRLSFRRFAGLSLTDAVPDHTTLCRFRNRLVQEGLLERERSDAPTRASCHRQIGRDVRRAPCARASTGPAPRDQRVTTTRVPTPTRS